MTEDKYNPPIVVLGMHRSGTSLISGILVELGVNMGNDPKHLKQHESNIFGHHEDKDFLSLNEEILKSQNLSWDNPPKYNYPDLDKEIITKISETIKSKQKQKYWGWKEPRTSVLIKSYLPYIPRAKYIICNRDNEEIYRSLIRRDQISRDKAKEITASYIKSINSFMKDNPDADILNINYSDLIESPEKYVKSIAKFIDTKPSKVNLKNAMNLVKPKDKLSSTISKLINKKAGDTPRVSLVVLSWNTKDSTLKCIDSLRKLKYSNKEIIVVDNGSSDGSKEALSKLKDVVYIDEPINLGFTGGQISALKEARGKYIALINSDAVVSRDWLNHLVGVAESDKKIAALGGRAYKWSEEYEAYDSSSPFYSYQEINPKTGYAETMDFGDEITDVHSISGAALLIRRSAIEKVGYFDNRFFAYFEETDLIARFIRAGMKAVFVPQAHVWHEIAASTKEVPKFYLYQMHRNRFIFGVKNVDNEHLMPFLINYTFEFFGSIFTYPLDGSIDKRMRIKAGLWNFFHLRKTFSDRKKVKKIGKSYSKKLKRYGRPEDVTVIITCYNYGKFVGEAIESVLNQTLKPKEIIVINDGSTDDSLHVINKYKDKVTIIDKINEGVVVAKNTGIKKSKTYWTLFLDADDYLREDALERYVYGARVNNASVVYSGMTYFGAISDYFGSRRFNIIDLLKLNFIHNSALIKTSLLKISGGYKSEMNKGLEDWELYVTLYEHGARFSWVPEGLLFYRQHEKTENRNSEALELNNELIGNIRTIHAGLYQRYRFIIRIPMKLRNKLAICLKNPEIIFVIPIALVKSVLGKRSVIHYIRAYLNKKYLYLRDF